MKNQPFLAAAVIIAATSVASASSYTFVTHDDPADPTFNQLLGVNNNGMISGYFGNGSDANPNRGYTLVAPATFTNENFPGSAQTQVVGINSLASPTTVGFWVDGNGNNFGFVFRNGVFTSVQDPNTPAAGTMENQLLGVNNNNVAAGFYVDGNGDAQGYLYNIVTQQFTAVTLPAAFNAMMTTVTGVNDTGVITGFYTDTNGDTHGFVDQGGTFTSFDDPNGANTMFFGINNLNQVVGSYEDGNGVTNGLVFNYNTLTWQTVNDPLSSANPAFDVTGTTINGINDNGQLVGFYSDGTNVNGFLASVAAAAVPEPASFGLVSLGAAIVLGLRRRKTLRT